MIARLLTSPQARLTVAGVVVFFACLWAVAFVVANGQEARVKDLLAAQQDSAVSYVANDIDGKVAMRLEAIATVARGIPTALLGETAPLQAFLAAQPLVYSLFDGGLVVVRPDGTSALADYPVVAGRTAASYADLDVFRAAVATDKAVLGRPLNGIHLGKPLLHFAAPVHGPDGKLAAVLIGITTLAAPGFLDSVAGQHLGASGDFIIAAPRYGIFVTGTDPAFRLKLLPPPGANALHDRVMKGFEGSDVTVSSTGVEQLCSVRRVPSADWFVIGRLPTAEAFAPVRAQRWLVFASSTALSLLAGAIALLFVRRENAALRRSEALLRQSQRIAGVGHYVFDIATGTWSSSEMLDEIFGIDAAYRRDVDGWLRLVHPAERDAMAAYLRDQVIGRRRPFDREYRIVRAADGAERWLHGIGKLEFAVDGHPTQMFGVIQDVTARKALEVATTESELKYRALFETATDGIFLQDATGFVDCNETGARMYGLTRAQLIGRAPAALSPERQPDGRLSADVAAENIQAALAGTPQFFEWQPQRADGTPFDVEITLNRLDIGGGVYLQAIVRDITARKRTELALQHSIALLEEHERTLERVAHYDGLTGIPNRILLADRMSQAIAQSARTGKIMAVCYLDLDNFKPINDTWGHAAGDRVLVEMAQRLKGCLRGGDTVARLGGDEFVLLLLGLEHVEECAGALGRILAAIARPLTVSDRTVAISASLGAALYPRDAEDADTLLRHADQAMYLAKQEGRNRYQLFAPTPARLAATAE